MSALQGRWEGRPDTAAARAEREKVKFGKAQEANTEKQESTESVPSTDWENYNSTVQFNFKSADRLEMSLAGNEEVLTGEWRIVVTTPAACTIEVVLDQPTDATGKNDPRRFELELDERDDVCVGFLLSEVGADRQLGSLYFRRLAPTQ